MRVALLANPRSGGSTETAAIEGRLVAHGATVRALDDHDYDAGDADRIAVAGGDGSVGPAAQMAARARVALAVIPTGTANNFARAMEIPDGVDEACALAATGERLRPVELCRMDGRPFVNAASAGLAVAAARRAQPFKRALGPLSYALGAAAAGLREPSASCRVTCDGERLFEGRAWQVVVAGTGAFGPGSGVGPTDHRDGLFDVVVVEAGSRLALVRRAYGLQRGTITLQDGVRHRRAAQVEFEGPADFNVDGEIVSAGSSTSFAIERAAFSLVVPAADTPRPAGP